LRAGFPVAGAFASLLLSGVFSNFMPSEGVAQGINTNVALAVAEDEGIFRSQIRYRRATDDPLGTDRELDVIALPQTLVYGWTPRITTFATLPIVAYRRMEASDGSVRQDEGLGDLRLLGRFTFFVDDYAPLSTRRAALLVGMKFPTGTDRIGTDSFDPIFGAVGTWAFNRHELDLDALYTVTTKRRDFEAGDEFRYDLAYRYRLWPARFGKRLLQLNGLLELNGRWTAKSRADGTTLAASGGNVLFLSPGVQFIAKRIILEASFQIPVWQNLNGSQLKDDWTAVVSARIPFMLGLR
jgi:hypothetical protein